MRSWFKLFQIILFSIQLGIKFSCLQTFASLPKCWTFYSRKLFANHQYSFKIHLSSANLQNCCNWLCLLLVQISVCMLVFLLYVLLSPLCNFSSILYLWSVCGWKSKEEIKRRNFLRSHVQYQVFYGIISQYTIYTYTTCLLQQFRVSPVPFKYVSYVLHRVDVWK